MEQQSNKKARALQMVKTLLLGGVLFFVGVYVGYENRPIAQRITSVIHKDSLVAQTTDFDPFWKAWAVVDEKLADADETSAQDRVYGAIKGMLASFDDPYTTFFTPSENEIFESEIAGTFDGIGIEIGEKDGVLTIIAPLKDTPAERAGLRAADKIIAIGETSTNELGIDKAISLIRGKAGTTVDLTIVREGLPAPRVFTVTRENIDLPTVDTEQRADTQTFVIHLYNFSAQSPQLFYDALREYRNSGYTNLVLDLRGNPGGYLDAAVTIAGWFIPEGQVIVKEIGKTETDVSVHTSKGPILFPKGSKLVVLVDKGSASASEILAGALSEQGIGILAGEQTYGKGSVQEVVKLTKDTSLKITVAKWYTPQGVSISDSGLTPSVKIPFTETTDDRDIQLEKAIELFKK